MTAHPNGKTATTTAEHTLPDRAVYSDALRTLALAEDHYSSAAAALHGVRTMLAAGHPELVEAAYCNGLDPRIDASTLTPELLTALKNVDTAQKHVQHADLAMYSEEHLSGFSLADQTAILSEIETAEQEETTALGAFRAEESRLAESDTAAEPEETIALHAFENEEYWPGMPPPGGNAAAAHRHP
ncbi:hypothetical protein AB4Y88_00055 [Paenarthrobacter sp. RAF9]